jgi:hypothetical protein
VQRLHERVLRTLMDTAQAPTYLDLARAEGLPPEEARAALRELMPAAMACWQYPGTDHIVSYAPFNNVPTRHRITIDGEQKCQPRRHGGRQDVQSMAQRFAYELQPIERTNRREYVAGVSSLSPVCFEQPVPTELLQEYVQQQPLSTIINQPTAELAEHCVVEARVLELQTQRILPINSTPHSVSCLAVRKIFNELKDRDQR